MQRKSFSDIRTSRSRKEISRTEHAPVNDPEPVKSARASSASPERKDDFFAYVKSDTARRSRSSVSRASVSRPAPARSPRTHQEPLEEESAELRSVELPAVEWRRPGKMEKNQNGQRAIWWIATVAVVVLVVMIMNVFSGATATITPRQENAFIQGQFTAMRGSNDPTILGFEVMNLAADESEDIPATAEQQVERRASGRIVIYNAYNTSDQRLVKKTRFEDAKGNIYRIDESVVVPGMRTENGETVPGSIEVTVYADEPGEQFNAGLVDLTVPGFKGTPQYTKIYARSKTEMTGGFIGKEKVASEEAVVAARADVERKLTETLLANARAQTPDGFILAEYGVAYSFQHADSIQSKDGKNVTLTAHGTLQIMMFNASQLARFVAKNSISSYNDADVYFSDPTQLSIGIVKEGDAPFVPGDQVMISLGGTPHIVWNVDEKAVIEALVGISKKRFDEIMRTFPNIASAQVSLHPFWKGSFPEDAKDISVVQLIDGKKK
ncbi:MAG: hypothetical protein HGA67_01060 [Candidatus Yonathbacteria bacterium]|nr:hypothetical protein [Candidatus Yonathbacteria bacterium]